MRKTGRNLCLNFRKKLQREISNINIELSFVSVIKAKLQLIITNNFKY